MQNSASYHAMVSSGFMVVHYLLNGPLLCVLQPKLESFASDHNAKHDSCSSSHLVILLVHHISRSHLLLYFFHLIKYKNAWR